MSKYIKLEDAINAIEYKIAEYIPTLYGRYAEIPLELRMAIEHLPSADVVEVVRCKDCKWYEKEWCYCGLHNNADKDIKPADYCSYGERIEE